MDSGGLLEANREPPERTHRKHRSLMGRRRVRYRTAAAPPHQGVQPGSPGTSVRIVDNAGRTQVMKP